MMTAKDAVGKIATLRRKRCGAQTNLYVLALGLGSSQKAWGGGMPRYCLCNVAIRMMAILTEC